jgi:hypothetical protein
MKRKRAPKAIVQQPVAQSYARFLATIKERILTAQVKVALAANAELVLHYWEIGRDILANQARQRRRAHFGFPFLGVHGL